MMIDKQTNQKKKILLSTLNVCLEENSGVDGQWSSHDRTWFPGPDKLEILTLILVNGQTGIECFYFVIPKIY
jgi:hypothetical protein